MMLPKIEDRPTALDWYNATYRPLAQDGDVACASGGKTVMATLIADVTGLPQHHVGMLFWWCDNLMVVEATANGITCGLFSQWWDRGYGQIEIYRLKPDYQKAFDPVAALNTACADMRKVKYDFQGIGNLAIYKLFGIDQRAENPARRPPDKGAVSDSERGFLNPPASGHPPYQGGNPDSSARRFCSASTARWTRHGGVDEFGKDDSLIVPGDYSISPMRELVVSLVGRDEPKVPEPEAVQVNS